MAINIRYEPTKRIPRDRAALKHAEDVAFAVETLKATADFQARAQLAMNGSAIRKAQAVKNGK